METPKLYYYKDIPKQTCFSCQGMYGAYYEDTEPGGQRSWHRYDQNGCAYLAKMYPNSSRKIYYISDKYGNPIKEDKMKISNEAKRLGTEDNKALERAERKAVREAAKETAAKAERIANLQRARYAQQIA